MKAIAGAAWKLSFDKEDSNEDDTKSAAGTLCILVLLGLSGCDNMSTREKDTAIGAGVGGAAGAVLTGGGAAGTIGGAVVGGVIGNQVGKPDK